MTNTPEVIDLLIEARWVATVESDTVLKNHAVAIDKGCIKAILPASEARPRYSPRTLHVLPDGTPAALLLTEECTRATVAVQLLPPFVWEDPLPPLPDTPAALTLQLTMQDVMQADTDPEALGRKLAGTAANKRWLHHPKAETFLAERVALLQRVYKR